MPTSEPFYEGSIEGVVFRPLAYHSDARGWHCELFRSDELETLQKIYMRLPRLDPELLEQAWRRAEQRTIPEILFLLQKLHDERSP